MSRKRFTAAQIITKIREAEVELATAYGRYGYRVDDFIAGVGTENPDNRSFRLNFEITAIVTDRTYAGQVEWIFLADIERSRRMTRKELITKPYWFRAAVRAAYVTVPVQ